MLQHRNVFRCGVLGRASLSLLFAVWLGASAARAQGPAPETAPPLFPGGGLVSYSSTFATRGIMPTLSKTARPTFSHEGDINFTWGFRSNFDLTILVPIVTNQFESATTPMIRRIGLGDAMALVKYRFYRRDSARGTTQASFTLGPKIPAGRTGSTDPNNVALPATLQPGSGSTDFFLGANWTYTGLLGLRRLVADEDFHALLRSEGTQRTRIGSNVDSRFWLSYRPYESKNGAREWFIGPELTWSHSQDDRIAGVVQSGSGGDLLMAGVTSYVGLRQGMHVWLGMDWGVAHSVGAEFQPIRRRISFGITKQFRIHS